MTVKRRDFQKAAALLHEFLLKLCEDTECAELRDALNLALLHMQRYYRRLRTRMQTLDKQSNGNHLLSQSLRGLSPMTPFRDTPDKFQWKWINLDSPKLANTLPTDLNKEFSVLPPIIQASKAGDNDILMEHIERDPDCIFEVDGIGRTALMYAVNFGHLDTVQILLENGIDVNAMAHDGSTAVHRVCHDGNHEALQILIEYEADLQIKDLQGRYPVHWASAHQQRSCLQLLLENRPCSVSSAVRDNDGMTPSIWACRMDNIEHFEILSNVQRAMEEDDGIERDGSGKTWMHWSVRRTDSHECLKTLLTEESANIQDEEGRTVIHTAAEMGSLPAVKIIMEIAGKEVLDHRDGHNRTPLILATIGGHGEVVNHLLTQGADLGCVDETGATAWDYACKRQLHYCMLILASYIRQRAKEEELGMEAGQTEGYNAVNGMIDGTLGLDHLEINRHAGDQPVLHGHRPMPPPHPPSEPPTPRTPRLPRPKTPHYSRTPRAQYQGNQAEPRVFSGGVKRSPSTPDSSDDHTFFERQNKPSSATRSKRQKNEHSPDREALMSVMSVESPEQGTPSRVLSAQSTRAHHSPNLDNEPEMANDSEYIDGDDDHSRVSIDAMDVSDFDADEEDEDEDEGEGQGHNHVPKGHSRPPEPSPRPPPQPNPRSQQNASPPYSIAPKSSSRSTAHQGSPPSRSADHGPAPQHHQNMRSPPPERHHKTQTGNSYYTHRPKQQHDPHEDLPPDAYIESPENGYADEPDDNDTDVKHSGEDRAHHIHFPAGSNQATDSRVVPPAHLSPLPNSMPPPARKKKKKKKKKEQRLYGGNDDFPQTRGYVAPIPPPLHQGPVGGHPQGAHQAPPTNQERSPPHGTPAGGGGGMVGTGINRPNSGDLKPMPKKRQQSAEREPSLSIDGKKRPSHLANAPPIGPKSLASRQTPTSAHVPPLPQAQPRPAPAHPRQTHSTLPDNRRITHHPDPATQQGVQLDESGDRRHGSSGHHDQGSSQGQPAPGRRFQNIKQNGMLDNDIEHQNGPVHKRPPVQGQRVQREPSPAPRDGQHQLSARSRRPPSGSLGGASQQAPPWSKSQVPNGHLPPSY